MAKYKDYFQKSIQDLQEMDGELRVAIVSDKGLVIDSNMNDATEIEKLSAFVSVFMDYGQRILNLECFEKQEKDSYLTTWVGTGVNRFMLVTRFLGGTFFIVLGKDQGQIGASTQRVLDLVAHAEPELREGHFDL